MPSFTDKKGNTRFSMNPQVGNARFGKAESAVPGMDSLDDNGDMDQDHVELHHGGHPEGDPPPHEGTKYHTIHGADIKNHDDYAGADSHMQECMGESEGADLDGGSTPPGDSAVYA